VNVDGLLPDGAVGGKVGPSLCLSAQILLHGFLLQSPGLLAGTVRTVGEDFLKPCNSFTGRKHVADSRECQVGRK
jgi:hypothetical protein